MLAKVQRPDWGNFAVRLHLRYVEKFADPEVAPLLQPDMDEASAVADVDNIPEI